MLPLAGIYEVTVSFVIVLRYLRGILRARIKFKTEFKKESLVSNSVSDEDKKLFSRIVDIMKKEELYLKPGLKLEDLCQFLQHNVNDLSRAINNCGEMHFFDFVNSYRIQKAKKLLSSDNENKKYSIEGIANLCGFKNKVSFYNAFRKFTNQTPSEFRKEITP